MAMDHADFIVDEEELMGEEEEDEVEENPDKPMYPALTLAAETVCILHLRYTHYRYDYVFLSLRYIL